MAHPLVAHRLAVHRRESLQSPPPDGLHHPPREGLHHPPRESPLESHQAHPPAHHQVHPQAHPLVRPQEKPNQAQESHRRPCNSSTNSNNNSTNNNSCNNSSSSNKDDKKRNRNGRLLPLAHRALEVKMTVSVPVEFLPPRSRLLQQRWWRRVEKWAMERKTPQLVEIVGRQVRQL